jgi:hypothetical protein
MMKKITGAERGNEGNMRLKVSVILTKIKIEVKFCVKNISF